MNYIYNVFLICFLLIKFSAISISSEIKIIYKINDTIITTQDIKNESDYLKALNSNLANLPDKELQKTASRSLIREKIKKKEIDKYFQIDYEKAINSSDINNVIDNIYSNLNFKTEEEFLDYLQKYNVTENSLRKKFVIEKMWNQLIVNKYSNVIKINKDEINKKVDKMISENKEINSFNLSEIVFIEKKKEDNKNTYLEIQKSIEKIGFEETAILYSISESAKLGGKIGWINENQISKKIINAISKINVGEYSEIINTAGGNIILKLNDKKKESANINREEEIKKLIRFKKNQLFTQYSIIFYKELENKSYVEKL